MARIWLELLGQYTITYTGKHAQWNTLMDMGEVKAEHVRCIQYFSLFTIIITIFCWEGFDFLFFFFWLLSFMLRALTMVTSSIFDILRTNMLTRTTAGPSGG